MNRASRSYVASLIFLAPGACLAHSFSVPYILPIPYWIYVYGCAATLVVTFAVLGVFAGNPAQARIQHATKAVHVVPQWVLPVLRVGAVGLLLLTILAGFIGHQDPAYNISLSLFWVIFLLGLAYLVALFGDFYALVNPWKTLIALLERMGLDLSRERLRYPAALGYWPAFVFYLALIWIELFFAPLPRTPAIALIVYSAITLIGVVLFGKAAWFSKADLFSNYFRLIGKIAPVEYLAGSGSQTKLRFRAPFSGLLGDPPERISLVLLVLCILSSTAYDAIYDTQYWTAFFWENAMWLLQPLWGTDLAKAQSMLMSSFLVYRKIGLPVFPFLYLIVYLLALLGAKLLTRTPVTLRSLALSFCYSLIPIAFAYNVAHYYTFLVSQIAVFPRLMTDPFGFEWNLLGLTQGVQDATLQMGVIWHTQVAIILVGHIASVALAHKVAMQVFATRRQVILSQLPMLLLMVAYTMLGLWILTLPLA